MEWNEALHTLMFHIKRDLKLNGRSVKHVFTGYDANSKRYKLYNPSNNKIVVTRDVEFDEKAAWNWEKQEENVYAFFPYFEVEDQGPWCICKR